MGRKRLSGVVARNLLGDTRMGADRPHRGQSGLCALLCAAVCLTAVSGASGQTTGRTSVQPGPQTCAKECHKDILSRKVMHGPARSDCGVCHVMVGDPDGHKFSYIVPKDQLCVRCHKLPHQGVMHAPVRDGRCMDCHDPHGSNHPKSLISDPKRDLCMRCHKPEFTKATFVHGPVAVGACIVCHRPHSSTHPKLLAQDARSLCLSCHSEVLARAGEGAHVHAALEQGCTRCHDAHASNHEFQLVESAPKLCLQCHQERFDQITAQATVVHAAVTQEGGCTVCHEPHASGQPGLQRGAQSGTCLACHNKALKTAGGAVIANMAALLAENPDHHGPIRSGDCTACHDPHAGKKFRLLTEEYPPDFYAPFQLDTFKLCFKCHIPDLVLKPTGRGLTQFRDGEQNLHWLHVNQEKGRTCRACHEVHASKRPAHIREAVPFGSSGWLLELNFEQTADGGTCSPACHAPRTYDRARTTAPPAAASKEGVK